MHIRPDYPKDAPTFGQLFNYSIHGLGGRKYSPAQLNAWAPGVPIASWAAE